MLRRAALRRAHVRPRAGGRDSCGTLPSSLVLIVTNLASLSASRHAFTHTCSSLNNGQHRCGLLDETSQQGQGNIRQQRTMDRKGVSVCVVVPASRTGDAEYGEQWYRVVDKGENSGGHQVKAFFQLRPGKVRRRRRRGDTIRPR
jgi:hypothetical protein